MAYNLTNFSFDNLDLGNVSELSYSRIFLVILLFLIYIGQMFMWLFVWPSIPLSWLLYKPLLVEIDGIINDPGKLLPSEARTKFETLRLLRTESFHLYNAIEEYYIQPVECALDLAQISIELCEVTQRKETLEYKQLVSWLKMQRSLRDFGSREEDTLITIWQLIQHAKNNSWTLLSQVRRKLFKFSASKRYNYLGDSDMLPLDNEVNMLHVNLLCQHIGCDVDELAMPRETINNLRKFASSSNQELAPLLEQNAKLNMELTTYERINAALQIRLTIEKLVSELPDTAHYKASGSDPKWKTLWKDTWKDAATNPKNPFHELWKNATGQYAKREYETKGADLFREMSAEIHGYDKRDFDSEHLDAFTRDIANALRPKTVDQNAGEVNWKSEVNKYKVFWMEDTGAPADMS